MNKKAKNRIFDAVMAASGEHIRNNPRYRNMVKKLILMRSRGQGRRKYKGDLWTEAEIIETMTWRYKENYPKWNAEESARLESSVGLMCGNKNT
jgi:hypothetical protein